METSEIKEQYEYEIPYTDEKGDFYCRIVHSILHESKHQHVCGIGCPFYDGMNEAGKINCHFLQEQEKVLGAVQTVDNSALQPTALWKSVEKQIRDGKDSLFPDCKDLPPILLKAYQYAAQMHEGQVRKGTDIPYFTHLITTMNYAMLLTEDVEVLAACVLHDTLEDTMATMLELQIRFGKAITYFVMSETENKRIGMPEKETWEMRKQENITHLQNAPYEVKIIVLADKTANAESMAKELAVDGEAMWQKFNQTDKRKQGWYYRNCEKALQELADTSVMKSFRVYLRLLFGD